MGVFARHGLAAGALCVSLVAWLPACGDDETAPESTGYQPDDGLPCGAGQRPNGHGCLDAGIPSGACAEGFTSESLVSCVPTLPAGTCPTGTMAIPGDTDCRPVAACGTSLYGVPADDANTLYVLAGAALGGDGSSQAPFATIQDAVDAAVDGGVIAVGAGTYEEDVDIRKPLRLWGKCPAETIIVGSADNPAVFAALAAIEIQDLSLTGAQLGLGVAGEATVLVDRVHVHDTGLHGINANDAFGAPQLTVRHSLIENAVQFGIAQRGATVIIEDSVVRGAMSFDGASHGAGVGLLPSPDTAQQSVTVRRSVIERSSNVGVFVAGGEAIIEGSVVRGTLPDPETQSTGQGVFAAADVDTADADAARARVTLTASLVDDNRSVGVHIHGSDLVVRHSVVRGTLPRQASNEVGYGIALEVQEGQPASAEIRESVIEANHDSGILASGSLLLVDASIIRNTKPQASDLAGGGGVVVQQHAESGLRAQASVVSSIVHDNHPLGMHVVGSDLVVHNTVVWRSETQAADGFFGRGIAARYDPDTLAPAHLELQDCAIVDNHDAGVLVAGSDAVLRNTIVRGTLARTADGRYGDGVAAFLPPELVPTTVTLERCTVEGNARAGVSSFGASVLVDGASFLCNPIDLASETSYGQSAQFTEVTPSECACAEEVRDCAVLTTQLEPPEI